MCQEYTESLYEFIFYSILETETGEKLIDKKYFNLFLCPECVIRRFVF